MKLAAPCNANQNAEIVQLLITEDLNQFWLGISDNADEGTWRDMNENIVSHENWHAGQPNGGAGTNCAAMLKSWGGTWNDDSCYKRKQYVCEGKCRSV